MRIAFNPSTVAALTSPPNNKDITFDLKGHNIFARGVEFKGTDTNTWRPVVDNLTSDSTTSSLSAKQGKVLKALIDGKSNSGHTHDDRYLKLTGGTLTGNLAGTSATFSGRFYGNGDDEGIIIKPASNGYAALTLGTHDGERSVFYFTKGNPFWRYNNGTYNLDIKHPKKAGTIALTSDIPTKGSWNYDDRYLRLSGGTMNSDALIRFADSGSWDTDKGPQGARGGLQWSGQSDYVKLYAEETAGDNLDLVIQFGDDNSNGLSIRNKSNVQTSYISAGGVITTGTFKGNLDWSYITNKPATATRWPSWAEVTGKPSSFTPSTHTHGLSNSVFFLNMPSISGNAKWKEVFGYPVNYNLLLSVRINSPAPEWCVGNYGSGILYGGSDTKGFMSSAYNEPLIMWAGGNGSSDDSVPKWYIGIRGTHKSIYNLTTIASEANAAYNLRHSHANKSVLDGITSGLVSNWNTAYTFVHTITGTDTDKVINKWDEIVNFLAGITEDNKLNTLLNSKLSVYELADKTNVGTIKNNGIYYSTTDASSGTLTNSPFNTGFALINMTSFDGGDLRRSRLAFNAYGEIKVSDDRDQANTAETWYNVLTSKNSGISGSTIKLNGTSITVYSSGTADGRYVKKSGDTMTGVLTIDTTNFGTLTIKRNDDTNGASIQFRGKSSVYGYIGLNNSTKDKQFLRWNSDTSKFYTILDTSSTYTSSGKGVINGTTITQVDNATNATNSTNARKLVNWYSARPTSLNAQFGDGSLRIFHATSSTTEGKPAEDSHILHLAWDNTGGWDAQLAVHTRSGKVSTRAQNGGTWQPWKTLAFTTDIPSSLKNPHPLTLKANGTTLAIYDGSSTKEANFTYANVGAASASHTHSYYAVNENYGGFKKAERLPTSGFYQSYISDKEESGGNAPWKSWMHLINCQHSNTGNNCALQIAASFFDNNIFKIRVTNNNVNTAWRDIIHSGNIGSQSVNYANSAGNSDKVDGYHATSSNKPWGTIPVITTSGWMDIGKHLEFHFDNTTGSDYSTILRCTGNYSNIVNLPSVAGTLALISDIPSSVKNPNAIKFKDINGNVVTYDGSVAKDLTAGTYMAKLPYGFSSFASGVSWGNTTGTSFASWNDSTGGSIDFRRDNPSSGKMSIKVDGRVYVNEGRNPVLSAESNSGFWGMRTPDGGNDWIRTPNNGLIPYVPGGAGGGHSSLGTSSWYFSTAYIDKIYGSLKGNADTASSANKLTTARNIALGTDLRGSANFDGSSNITINANINACTIGVGSTNGLPFKRIAHFETGSSQNDNALLLYISQGYINGSNGICRVEFRTDNISSSNSNPSASSSVRWLVRNGYGLDSLYAGYYVTTGKAYIDIYLKTTGSYQGTVIRVLQDSRGGINSNVQLISSYYYSDTNHKEAYSSIEAASTALYNRAYTRIVSGSDVGTVSYSNSTGSVHWNNVTNKPSSFTPSSHTHTWTSITGKLVAGNEFNIVNAGFNAGMWFNYLPINDRNKTATISGYHFGNGAKGYTAVKASGFIKNGSNDSYVLLGGGSHKTESSLRVAYASSAGSATSATKVIVNQHTTNDTNYPLVWSNQANTSNVTENQLYKSWADLYYNPKNKRLTVGGSVVTSSFIKSGGTSQQLLRADGGIAAFNWTGQSGQPTWLWGGNSQHSYYLYNPSNFRVAYASSAGNADTLDGEHASSFVRAGAIEVGSPDLNALDTYSFIKSVNSQVAGHSPKGNIGWYNVIQLVHRNGAYDGPNYIGQIALGMTTNTNDMFFRGKRTDPWKTVIHSGNIGSQTVANAYHLHINSANSWSTWNWAGQSGQPSWLWGSNDGTNMYVWNPSNFNVNSAQYLRSLGNKNCQTGRTQAYGDVYTYNTHSDNTGSATTYSSVIGFGRGTGGTVEIAGGWCDTNLYWRSLRDCCEDWHSWRAVLDESNYASILNNTYLPLAGGTMKGNARIGHGSGSLYIGNSGNDGWLYVQDMASQAGEANWKIYANGFATFKNLTVNGPTVVNGSTTLNSVTTLNGLVTNNRGILPASYDVNKNNTACYVWGDAMSTGVTAITDALDPKYVSVHYSNDNGASWTNYNLNSGYVFNLYANNGRRTDLFYLGHYSSDDKSLTQVQKNQLMVTFEIPNTMYSALCWASVDIGQGVQTVCRVEIIAKDGTIKNTFTKNLYGWNAVNYINFWGNNSSIVNIGNDTARFVRFKFKHDANNTATRNAQILKIRLFSFTKYNLYEGNFSSHMAYSGHLYTYDKDLNAAFPNGIKVTYGPILSRTNKNYYGADGNGAVINTYSGGCYLQIGKDNNELILDTNSNKGNQNPAFYIKDFVSANRLFKFNSGLAVPPVHFLSTYGISDTITIQNKKYFPYYVGTQGQAFGISFILADNSTDLNQVIVIREGQNGEVCFIKDAGKGVFRYYLQNTNLMLAGGQTVQNSGTFSTGFDDGKARFIIYSEKNNTWYEFYCG